MKTAKTQTLLASVILGDVSFRDCLVNYALFLTLIIITIVIVDGLTNHNNHSFYYNFFTLFLLFDLPVLVIYGLYGHPLPHQLEVALKIQAVVLTMLLINILIIFNMNNWGNKIRVLLVLAGLLLNLYVALHAKNWLFG